MNKIAIVVGAALSAAYIQAATVTWTMTNVYGPDGSTFNSGKAYMLAYLTDATSPTKADSIGAAIQDAYKNGYASKTGTEAVEALLAANNGNYSWTPGTAGTYTDSSKDVDPVSDLGLTGGSKYNMYAVIFDTDTISDTSKFFVTKELANKTVPTGSSNLGLAFGTMATTSTAEGAWQPVPEPTTVALLALGLAAVGLKRKVA